jgi:hypothetical protein
MAISGWTVPYGSKCNTDIQGHPSVKEIRGDGKVEESFHTGSKDEFVPAILDPRIRDYLLTGLPPTQDWKRNEAGEWCYGQQRLSTREGLVSLKSWILENHRTVTHWIEAPYHWATGQVNVRQSTESFKIIPKP